MRKTYYIATLLLIMVGNTLFAQDRNTKKADKHYDRLEFVKAAEKYEDIVEDGDATSYVYLRLANSYYNLYNTKQAELYYKMYLNEATDVDSDTYYRYAQMLKANKKYEESNSAMSTFASKFPNDNRAKAFKSNPDYLTKLLNNETKYRVKSLEDLNTELSDFGGYEYDDKLYFVSTRNKSRRDYGWNGQPTLDVYMTNRVGDTYAEPALLKGEVNSKYHEGTISISNDGKTMYFTRNDYLDGDYEKDSTGIGQLKIYTAKLVNGEWDDIQSASFNSSEYSTGHTALSVDGKTLYFSSDMPGGEGMSDLYRVSINEDGSFGTPVNLGSKINTSGKESFPFVDKNGTLYFSSDGQLGIGGLDVFAVEANGSIKNMGKPINSTGDDFAFFYNLEAKRGFVSSNRGGIEKNVANDNIYEISEVEIIELMLEVTIIDEETGSPISNAEVLVYDNNENQIAKAVASEDGIVDFTLPGKTGYVLQINADNYESNSAMVSDEAEGETQMTVELSPIKKMIQEEEIVLNPIFFEFDKSRITKEGALELDKLVSILKKHEDINIFVRSHTDKRGEEAYNLQLSKARAKSTVEYVVSKGIDASRIEGEGFGESSPKVECDSCTEEQYQMNRRSEFKIVE